MSSAGNVNNFEQGISKAEFDSLLGNSMFTDSQKNNILSIFDKVSNYDNTLSADEWDNFVNQTNTDGDDNLSDTELENATKRVENKIFNFDKYVVINFYHTIVDYIESITKNNEDMQEVYHTAEPNPFRRTDKHKRPGTFDYKWLEKDKYGSTTYEKWITNLRNEGYEYDEETGKKLLQKTTAKRKQNYCAESVRNGMENVYVSWYKKVKDSEQNIKDGEKIYKTSCLSHGTKPQGHAYKYASEFVNNPYFREIPHNIVATMNLNHLPIGCVFIYDAQYKVSPKAKTPSQKNHTSGHIGSKATPPAEDGGMDEGGGRQSLALEKQSTHIRVFMPVKPTWV